MRCRTVPRGAGFGVKEPLGCHSAGSTVTYRVESVTALAVTNDNLYSP